MGNPSEPLGRYSNAETSALRNAVTKGCTLLKLKSPHAHIKAFMSEII